MEGVSERPRGKEEKRGEKNKRGKGAIVKECINS